MINAIRNFIHKKCAWALVPWRVIYNGRNQFLRRKTLREAACVQLVLDGVEQRLRVRKGPIRVGFYVFNDAVFPLEPVLQLMLKDEHFRPGIVVVSDAKYDDTEVLKSRLEIHRRTVSRLSHRYDGIVYDSLSSRGIVDYSNHFDVCIATYPYDGYAGESCRMSYLAKQGKLVVYTDYGTYTGCVQVDGYLDMSNFSFLWRYYAGVDEMAKRIAQHHPSLKKHQRIVLSGSPKMSDYARQPVIKRDRKRVIIAPHHTIIETELFHISNFVQYAEFFLRLPEKYPDIDWVFRPHPNLLPKMVDGGYWTKVQQEEYIRRWTSYPNAEYQSGGPYYETLVNSDGLIQDCASFLAEYFATGHPQCYLLKSPEHEKKQYGGLGLEMLENVYRAYNEDQVIRYIEDVVIAGNDPMKEKREVFAREKLLINYPHVAEFILNDIKKALGRA